MARNGSGTMSVTNTFVAGATITAAGHNTNNTDIAAEITNSLALDGQSTMTGQAKFANGTAGAPSITFGSDLDTGFYRRAGNSVGVALAGADYIEIATASVSIGQGAVGLSGTLTVNALVVNAAAQIVGNAVLNGNLSVSATAAFGGPVTASATVAMTTGTVSGGFTVTGAVSGGTVAGSMVATQAEQETGSATDKVVTPGRQHFHPSAAKAWCKFDGSDGTVNAGYNITSVTKNSTGNYTITIANDFSSAHYAVSVCGLNASVPVLGQLQSQAAGSFTVAFTTTGGGGNDVTSGYVTCFGDLP